MRTVTRDEIWKRRVTLEIVAGETCEDCQLQRPARTLALFDGIVQTGFIELCESCCKKRRRHRAVRNAKTILEDPVLRSRIDLYRSGGKSIRAIADLIGSTTGTVQRILEKIEEDRFVARTTQR